MGQPTVGVARLRVVPEKVDGRPGGRDHRGGSPGSADMIPLEARGDTSRSIQDSGGDEGGKESVQCGRRCRDLI